MSRDATPPKTKAVTRCSWVGDEPIYIAYHDEEWGVPEHDGRALFEKLLLDGFQAGLSWITILRKRENFRRAFHDFDAGKIARFSARDVERLMNDAGIVRNRAKIEGSIGSAKAWLKLQDEGGFAKFCWQFVGGKPLQMKRSPKRPPMTESDESRALSKALKSRGFAFVGPTIVYAFMQAVGMVNDHATTCFRHDELI